MRAIMLMFDTLSKDFLSNYGNDWIQTPNFDRLREKRLLSIILWGSMPCMPARRELHTGRYNFMHRMWGNWSLLIIPFLMCYNKMASTVT